MILRLTIVALCAVGLYCSLVMSRKTRRDETSIVTTAHARLFFGVPNARLGCWYYIIVAIVVAVHRSPRLEPPAVQWLLFAGVLAAAATSLFLAYSLLFVTRRDCPYCWTSHAVNWMLLVLVPAYLR